MNQKTMLIILGLAAAAAAAWYFLRKKIASPNTAVALPPIGGSNAQVPAPVWSALPPPVSLSSGSLAVTSTVKSPSAANLLGSGVASATCLAYGGGPLCGVAGKAGGLWADTTVSAAKKVAAPIQSLASKLKFW